MCFEACLQHPSHALEMCTLAFTYCLNGALRSSRGETLGPSLVFPEPVQSPLYVYNPVKAHSLQDSQEYLGLLKTQWASHSKSFPFNIFG